MGRKIGIVGAGISGLLACKYVLSKGFIPIVFESRSTIGGLWTKTMETTKLQTPKPFYQFSDFPWPSSIQTSFPNHYQLLDYLHSYAKHFDLLKHIRFDTKVSSITYEGPSEKEIQSWTLWGGNGEPFGRDSRWSVTVENIIDHSTEVIHVDFIVLCVGRFSEVPNTPEFSPGKGPEECDGKVMHSEEYCALDYKSAATLVKGNKVTVVGYGKTALDIALECSMTNGVENPCTIICRAPRWHIPENWLWTFPLKYLYLTRFAELWVQKPGDGLFLSVVASLLLWPLRWMACKAAERKVRKMYGLKKYGMLPEYSFLKAMNSCKISIIPDGFYDKVEEGSINVKRCSKFSFCKQGITLEDSTESVDSDLVILATGFKGEQKVKDIFASSTFQDSIMASTTSLAPLYRSSIHPKIPQLAIVGFQDSLSYLYSSELECRWLAELLDRKFKVPSIRGMEEDIMRWDKLMNGYSDNDPIKRCVGALHIWHNDLLTKDMGWDPKRKNQLWDELFEPYGPMDYAEAEFATQPQAQANK